MFDFPLSPGITKNQDLKDRVLQDVYHRKIKDLKSMHQLFSCVTIKSFPKIQLKLS